MTHTTIQNALFYDQGLQDARCAQHGLLHHAAYRLAHASVRRSAAGLVLSSEEGSDLTLLEWEEGLTLFCQDSGVRVTLQPHSRLQPQHLHLLHALCTVPERLNPESYPLDRLRKLVPSTPELLTTPPLREQRRAGDDTLYLIGLYDPASELYGHLATTSHDHSTLHTTELWHQGQMRLHLSFENNSTRNSFTPTRPEDATPGTLPLCGPLDELT